MKNRAFITNDQWDRLYVMSGESDNLTRLRIRDLLDSSHNLTLETLAALLRSIGFYAQGTMIIISAKRTNIYIFRRDSSRLLTKNQWT